MESSFNSTAHLADFLRLAGLAVVGFILMIAVVRFLPASPRDSQDEPNSLDEMVGQPLAAEPGSDAPSGSRRVALLKSILVVAGAGMIVLGLACFFFRLNPQAKAIYAIGLLLLISSRLLGRLSLLRKALEATALGILLVDDLWPGHPTIAFVAALGIYLIARRQG